MERSKKATAKKKSKKGAGRKKVSGLRRLENIIRKSVNDTIEAELRPEGLPGIIAGCFDNIESMVYSCELYSGLAENEQQKNHERVTASLRELTEQDIEINSETSAELLSSQLMDILYSIGKIIRKNRRLLRIQLPDIVLRSFFLNLFSVYDAFSGDLLRWLYAGRPSLANAIQRTFTLADAKKYEMVSEFVKSIIEKEIDTFRRKSYVEQFSTLEGDFSIKLTKFDAWSDFVECSQRRNLIMHTDGIVTPQYLEVCGANGVDLSGVVIGSRLRIDKEYFLKSARLIQKVSFMLSHTLWRKVFDEKMEKSDKHMREFLFDLLVEGQYHLAIDIGKFCAEQKRFSSDADRRIIIINYALAMLYNGNRNAAISVLDKEDWSSTLDDFKLANAVIRNDLAQVVNIMRKIGRRGTYLDEDAYIEWPLFSGIRSNSQFQSVFKEIFGKDLVEAVKADASNQAYEQLKLIND